MTWTCDWTLVSWTIGEYIQICSVGYRYFQDFIYKLFFLFSFFLPGSELKQTMSIEPTYEVAITHTTPGSQ